MLYDTFRPIYPGLSDVLMTHTQCIRQDVENYDQALIPTALSKSTQKSDKAKRDLFRKIASRVPTSSHRFQSNSLNRNLKK